MALYMIGGAVRHAVALLQARRLDDDDVMEEPDPDPFEI
jgi:hypothetical protein